MAVAAKAPDATTPPSRVASLRALVGPSSGVRSAWGSTFSMDLSSWPSQCTMDPGRHTRHSNPAYTPNAKKRNGLAAGLGSV